MNCIDYRRLLTSDPSHGGAEVAQHRLACRSCAAFTEQLQQLDRRMRDAMMVAAPRDLESRVLLAAVSQRHSRQKWYAIAAGAVLGLAISFGLMLDREPPPALGASVMEHIYHETDLLAPSADVVARPQLVELLEQVGVRLVGEVGEVSHAGLCYFRGHLVPHMVVRGEQGPVTVMLLPDEPLDEPVAVNEQGFTGTIVPVSGGSIAVVGTQEAATRAVQQQFTQAVEWDI